MGAARQPLTERFDAWVVRNPRKLRELLRAPALLWRLGLGPLVGRLGVRGGHLVLLTVTGRATGLPRHTPVAVHLFRGQTYLWCPYGGRAQWYRNLTANPIVTVQSHRGTHAMRACGIEDVGEATDLVAELRRFDEDFLLSYLHAEGIPATPEGIAANVQRLHLRRLEPTGDVGPPPLGADLVWLWPVAVAAAAASGSRLRHRCRPASRNRPRATGSLAPRCARIRPPLTGLAGVPTARPLRARS